MQKILFKRSLRNLKSNLFSYIALFLLILVCMIVIVCNNISSDILMQGTTNLQKESNVEDGNVTMLFPLSSDQLNEVKDKGVTFEENFSLDYSCLNDGEKEATLRVFKNRNQVNKLTLIDGALAKAENEIAIEKRFFEVHNLKINDKIKLAEKELKIVGVVVSSDYENVLQENGTPFTNPQGFGTAFVTAETYSELKALDKAKNTESYVYSYKLNDKMTHQELKDLVKGFKISNEDIISSGIETTDFEKLFLLTQSKLGYLLEAKDNMRINATYNDQIVNKQSGILAGVIILLLFSYVLSVFVSHEISEDEAVIGTLYALGVKRTNIVMHYLYAPVFVSLLAGILGYLVGSCKGVYNMLMQSSYTYFSIPEMPKVNPLYLIIYSIVLPPLMSLLVNFIVIFRKLNRPVLSLIRHEGKTKTKASKLKLNKLNFTQKFQMRQFVREGKSSLAVVGGMLICTIVLMLSLNCQVMCSNLAKGAETDTKFNYAYTYKMPTKEPPEEAELAYGENFKKEMFGYQFDITLLGIDDDNKYFDVTPSTKDNEVIISNALATKFHVKKGDTLKLDNGSKYEFKVAGITQFTPSFYMFMDINKMRDLFDKNEGYFNVAFSDKEIEIPPMNLYTTVTKADITKAAGDILTLMNSMIWSLMILSIVIFITVMYLMLKMMLDKSRQNISLLSVFGYEAKEIRKLYLDGNFFVVMIGALISIPLAKVIMDMIYPMMCSNVACAIETALPWWYYLVTFVGIMVLYLITNALLTRKIKKISPSEVIQNRE